MTELKYAFDHVSVIVGDVNAALEFYHGVLGLELSDERPDLDYPGAWLKLGNYSIHLLELDNPDSINGRPQHGGKDRHFAIKVNDLSILISRLKKSDINYSMSKSGRRALFCRDTDSNAIEII